MSKSHKPAAGTSDTAKRSVRMGRPPGSGAPIGERRKPRSIRLNDPRWAKLQRLGSAWLERMIDAASESSARSNPKKMRDVGIDSRLPSLSVAQIRVMRWMSRGCEAHPGSGSTLNINGQRVCNIDTMTVLRRAGFVEQDRKGIWRATASGIALRDWLPEA